MQITPLGKKMVQTVGWIPKLKRVTFA